MIQRVQSLYLLLASLALGLSLCLPLLSFKQANGDIEKLILIETWGQWSTSTAIPLVSFFMVACLSFIIIFLFKNRKFQLTLCKVALGITFVTVAYLLYDTFIAKSHFAGLKFWDATGLVAPFSGIIFLFFAMKGIRADEKLIRSLDRIR